MPTRTNSTVKKDRHKIPEGTKGFHDNWKSRKEALRNYWRRGIPRNQIELAFRKHWEFFQELLGRKHGKCLEVGCGRGTMSSYFADAGWDCTLLDYSEKALDLAREIFARAGLKARFVCDDANKLPFKKDSFDVVVSIGLLEHFEDIATPLKEQVRVLKPGGRCLAYIIPERPENVQRYFQWLNSLLKAAADFTPLAKKTAAKSEIYRNDSGSHRYIDALEDQPVEDVQAFGVYPLPMISHSPEFPFSLLPAPVEFGLTRVFESVLAARKAFSGRNPWVCDEEFGQAFLLTFRKTGL